MEKEKHEYHETMLDENSEDSKKENMTDNRENEDNGVANKDTSSEYETNGSSSDEEEIKKNLDNEREHDFESDDGLVLEREEGDGQESVSLKKVDDDEDKKNPQYIPKRGTFYEHDDRTLEDSEDKQETSEKNEKQNKKNVWMEKKERWSHDRYNDNEQAPKSRSELVSIYGYDIRNEDGPPKARRRRRYGRGPNKYTRTWEDEDAYKPTKPVKVVKPKNKKKEDYLAEEFETNEDTKEETVVKDENILEEVKSQQISPSNTENKIPTNVAPKYKQEPSNRPNNSSSDHSNYRLQNQRIGTGRVVKSKPEIKKEIKDSDYRGFTKTRQFRNSKSEQKVLPKNYKIDNSQRRSNSNEDCTEDIQKELFQMNIKEESLKSNKQINLRQNSVPPRLQAEQKGSKRYSSLRQRSLPETVAPSFNQAANYYATEYSQTTQPAPQQGLLQQPNSIHGSTPPLSQIPPPPLPTIAQVPVTANPILQAPPQFATPFPQAPPPFLPPTVPTASFIPQPAPPIINYVQGQAQFPQAPPYQGYQHQQFNTVNQAAELYQCQGGTTYYSTQNQHISQRSVPQKRPKAAIPIVPPPPQEPRGRGRSNRFRDNSMQGEEMCETVITNSNIYEDSILYVQQ